MDYAANEDYCSSTPTFQFDKQPAYYIEEYSAEHPTTAVHLDSLQYNPLVLSPQSYSFDPRPLFLSQQHYYPAPNADYTVFPTNRPMAPSYSDYDPLLSPSAYSVMNNSIPSISPPTPSEPLYAHGRPNFNLRWSSEPTLQSDLPTVQPMDFVPEKGPRRCGGGRALICPTCKKRHTRKNRMEDCTSRDKEQKRHPCKGQCGDSACIMVYVSADGLRRHRWSEEHRKVYCSYCSKLSSRQNIARHKSTCPQRPNKNK